MSENDIKNIKVTQSGEWFINVCDWTALWRKFMLLNKIFNVNNF